MQNKLQYPENALIIGFHGARGAGKTTAARGIGKYINEKVRDIDHWSGIHSRVHSFADPIRQFIYQFMLNPAKININLDQLTTFDKEQLIYRNKSFREIAQTTGDFFRNLNPDYFNDYITQQIITHDQTSIWGDDTYLNIILIDDVRYPNEAELIKEFGGFIIELRKFDHSDQLIQTITHSSDQRLPDNLIDQIHSYYIGEVEKLIIDMTNITYRKIMDKINGK